VIPLAPPDEAVLLEDLDDLPRHAVLVGVAAVGVGLGPVPVVGIADLNTASMRWSTRLAVSGLSNQMGVRTSMTSRAVASATGRPASVGKT